jgi:Xaa-Pro aminopeptidase
MPAGQKAQAVYQLACHALSQAAAAMPAGQKAQAVYQLACHALVS